MFQHEEAVYTDQVGNVRPGERAGIPEPGEEPEAPAFGSRTAEEQARVAEGLAMLSRKVPDEGQRGVCGIAVVVKGRGRHNRSP
jgi:hypothetical protein